MMLWCFIACRRSDHYFTLICQIPDSQGLTVGRQTTSTRLSFHRQKDTFLWFLWRILGRDLLLLITMRNLSFSNNQVDPHHFPSAMMRPIIAAMTVWPVALMNPNRKTALRSSGHTARTREMPWNVLPGPSHQSCWALHASVVFCQSRLHCLGMFPPYGHENTFLPTSLKVTPLNLYCSELVSAPANHYQQHSV